jgi:hypothetical protein
VFPEISVHRGLVVKRRDRYEDVRDRDANSAAATLTQSNCNVVDFAYIHHLRVHAATTRHRGVRARNAPARAIARDARHQIDWQID